MHALHSAVALTPAPAGWAVVGDSPLSNHPGPYSLIAWATVVVDFDDAGAPITQVQPVFLVDGKPYTPMGAGIGDDYTCREPSW